MLSTNGVEAGYEHTQMIEEGTWDFFVSKAEVKTSQVGNLYVALECKSTSKEQAGRTVWHNLLFTEKTAPKSLQAMVALGFKGSFDEDDSTDLAKVCKKLEGSKFVGRVYHKENTYNGESRVRANLASVKPLSSAVVVDDDDDSDEIPF